MKGFTLLETIIYMALFSFMLTSIFGSIFYMQDIAARSRIAAGELLRSLNAEDSEDYGTHAL